MISFKIKINGKYVKDFEETEKKGTFIGNWHNHTPRMITVPVFGSIKEAKIIEGKRNLKSYAEKVLIIQDDGFLIDNFSFERVNNEI